MTTVEEHRTHFRKGDTQYTVEVRTEADDGGFDRKLSVRVDGADPDGQALVAGALEVDFAELDTVAELLSDELRTAAGLRPRGRRRPRAEPARKGQPWTPELDAELEKRWIAGEGLREIAAQFERTQSAIQRRLPLIGCDPYTPGAYLPPPPSQRD